MPRMRKEWGQAAALRSVPRRVVLQPSVPGRRCERARPFRCQLLPFSGRHRRHFASAVAGLFDPAVISTADLGNAGLDCRLREGVDDGGADGGGGDGSGGGEGGGDAGRGAVEGDGEGGDDGVGSEGGGESGGGEGGGGEVEGGVAGGLEGGDGEVGGGEGGGGDGGGDGVGGGDGNDSGGGDEVFKEGGQGGVLPHSSVVAAQPATGG